MKTLERERRAVTAQRIGDVSKREMITSLIFQRIRRKGRVNDDNALASASFLGFFVWLFSLPYDAVMRLRMRFKFKRQSAKIKAKKDR